MPLSHLNLPNTPDEYFFRVSTVIGVGILELRRKTFFGLLSTMVEAVWLEEGTDEDIEKNAAYIWKKFQEHSDYRLRINDRLGDYT